ncbi:Juvenile hormone-inducible protein [Anopheles darlingi]|uniref:Juvenile hormone-inducible protein n=1 Tax=Anopheles darlingi TaxID=43151 RepID=W5J3T2_ANODA|nr:Juvenile hormone-inducible protein [Anopheles darlingi]
MSSTSTVPEYVRQRVLIVAKQQGFGNNPNITYEPGSKTGDGYIGLIVRARLIETNPTARPSLSIICKFPPEDRQQREQFNAMALFEREHFIYQRVLPAFEELQQECGLSVGDDLHFGNYPKCYHSYCDTERGEAVLILEDLIDPDRPALTMLNQYDRVDYDHVRVLMVALGKLNACSFALKQQRPELFAEIQRLNDLLSIVLNTEQMAPLTPRHCMLAASAFEPSELPPDHRAEMLNLATDMWRRAGAHIQGKHAEPYAALNHGDCWTNNVMFGYDAEGHSENYDEINSSRSSQLFTIPSPIRYVVWEVIPNGSYPGMN